jgi:hypothetical protein
MLPIIIIIIIIIIAMLLSYHMSSSPPPPVPLFLSQWWISDFKYQIVAPSLWWVMFLVWRFFVENLLNVILVLFQDFFKTFPYNSRGPNDYFYFDGVRLHLWTAATNGYIVYPQYDIWVWKVTVELYRQGKKKNSKKSCPSAIFSTTNSIWIWSYSMLLLLTRVN